MISRRGFLHRTSISIAGVALGACGDDGILGGKKIWDPRNGELWWHFTPHLGANPPMPGWSFTPFYNAEPASTGMPLEWGTPLAHYWNEGTLFEGRSPAEDDANKQQTHIIFDTVEIRDSGLYPIFNVEGYPALRVEYTADHPTQSLRYREYVWVFATVPAPGLAVRAYSTDMQVGDNPTKLPIIEGTFKGFVGERVNGPALYHLSGTFHLPIV